MGTGRLRLLVLLLAMALAGVTAVWLFPTWRALLGNALGQWRDYVLFLIIVVAIVFVLVLALWRTLKRHLNPDGFSQKKDFILLIAQILGGATLLISLFSTWQSINKTQQELKAQRAQMELNQKTSDKNLELAAATLGDARRRQLSERFEKAVEQLSSKDLSTRVGAIYAFEQVAIDAIDSKLPQYHWPIMQILAAYVRSNAPCNGNQKSNRPADTVPPDIEAVMTVIGRRKLLYMKGEGDEDTRLNLRNTDLRGLVLKGVIHFEGIDFQGACFDGARLRGVLLSSAMLKGASLCHASLYGADLRDTGFENACLEGADLQNTFGYDWEWISVADGLDKALLPKEIKEAMLADQEYRAQRCSVLCERAGSGPKMSIVESF